LPDLTRIDIKLEHEVLPPLKDITNLYGQTYQRYADGIVDLETLKGDMKVVKLAVTEHSKKLKNTS
jgi:hypothetical protein